MAKEMQPQTSKLSTLTSLVRKYEHRIATALPNYLSAERMLAVSQTEIQKNPGLLECDPGSVIGSIVQAAELGLEFGAKRHAYLVPFRQKGRMRCQLLIDYRGLAFLAERHPNVKTVWSYTVRRADAFSFQLGDDPRVFHKPDLYAEPDPEGADIVAAYAVVELVSGRKLLEVLPRWEIDKVRDSSRASGSGPWVQWYERMARKTALRRALNLVSVSGSDEAATRLAEAVRVDDEGGASETKVELEERARAAVGGGGSSLDLLGERLSDTVSNGPKKAAKTTRKPKKRAAKPKPEPEAPQDEPQVDEGGDAADRAADPFELCRAVEARLGGEGSDLVAEAREAAPGWNRAPEDDNAARAYLAELERIEGEVGNEGATP